MPRRERDGRYENQELAVFSRSENMAGMIESAMTAGFKIRADTKHVYATPIIQYVDNDNRRLRNLIAYAGGKIFDRKGNSRAWYISGEDAVNVMSATKKWIVSRNEVVLAFENWLIADVQERVEIARELRMEGGRNNVMMSDYESLVKNKGFVAGVLDTRGGLYDANAHKTWELIMGGQNKLLMHAMCKEYGGSVVGGETSQWRLGKENLLILYEKIRDSLILRKEEYEEFINF